MQHATKRRQPHHHSFLHRRWAPLRCEATKSSYRATGLWPRCPSGCLDRSCSLEGIFFHPVVWRNIRRPPRRVKLLRFVVRGQGWRSLMDFQHLPLPRCCQIVGPDGRVFAPIWWKCPPNPQPHRDFVPAGCPFPVEPSPFPFISRHPVKCSRRTSELTEKPPFPLPSQTRDPRDLYLNPVFLPLMTLDLFVRWIDSG